MFEKFGVLVVKIWEFKLFGENVFIGVMVVIGDVLFVKFEVEKIEVKKKVVFVFKA